MMKKYVYKCAVLLALLSMAAVARSTPKPPSEDLDRARQTASAIFAGGCFWCMEPPYDKLDGVLETISGYSGGHEKDPTYQQVSSGGTGHYEVVKVVYDPSKVSYDTLLETFWHNVDPLDAAGQFCDKGQQYLSAIFVTDPSQKSKAKASKRAAQKALAKRLERPLDKVAIVTPILDHAQFYPAEEYHQDYYQKNPLKYRYYRYRCGRDARLDELWGKMATE